MWMFLRRILYIMEKFDKNTLLLNFILLTYNNVEKSTGLIWHL